MIVRAIIQARMGSSRLRGKTLSPINGVPLLKRVVDAVRNLAICDEIYIATSALEEDDPIEVYASNNLNCTVVRGDRDDVFSRFLSGCGNLNDRDVIVRVTADNLFYQATVCRELLALHKENQNDYTGIEGLSHLATEFIRVGAFRKVDLQDLTPYDKEHVTPYFIQNPSLFKTCLVTPSTFGLQQHLDRKLTVDSVEDRTRIEQLLQVFTATKTPLNQAALYSYLERKNS
ncbi:NTP transferase domain-containing protein [Flavobacteriaceae bacterium F08102]|nr:NTP transferase domain-containing protein [Flavobacteriaceae bacterium F08102]